MEVKTKEGGEGVHDVMWMKNDINILKNIGNRIRVIERAVTADKNYEVY